MKPSQRIALFAVLAGIACGVGFHLFLPSMPWWLPTLFGLLIASGVYRRQLRVEADKALVDRL